MSNKKEQNELLLTAYLDGELSPSDIHKAEQLLQQPEYAELLDAWKKNRELLQALPQFHLKDSFAEEVLEAAKINAAIEDGHAVGDGINNPVSVASHPPVNWKAGMAAIISLASMVLLSLFVFPQMGTSPIVSQLDTPVPGVGETSENPVIGNGAETTDDGLADAAYRDPDRLGELFSRSANKVVKNVEPGQILSWIKNPTAISDSSGHGPLGIFQIELTSESFSGLEEILKANKIELRKSEETEEVKTADRLLANFNSNLKVLYVVSTPLQMKKAMASLKVDHEAKIQPLRIPDGIRTSDEQGKTNENPVAQNGISRPSKIAATAQQLIPFENDTSEIGKLDSKPEDIEEIDQLDQWFGLTGRESTLPSQYLLLIEVDNPN